MKIEYISAGKGPRPQSIPTAVNSTRFFFFWTLGGTEQERGSLEETAVIYGIESGKPCKPKLEAAESTRRPGMNVSSSARPELIRNRRFCFAVGVGARPLGSLQAKPWRMS